MDGHSTLCDKLITGSVSTNGMNKKLPGRPPGVPRGAGSGRLRGWRRAATRSRSGSGYCASKGLGGIGLPVGWLVAGGRRNKGIKEYIHMYTSSGLLHTWCQRRMSSFQSRSWCLRVCVTGWSVKKGGKLKNSGSFSPAGASVVAIVVAAAPARLGYDACKR